MKTTIFDFDLEKYNFTAIISGYLNTDDLTLLKAVDTHESMSSDYSLYKNMEQTAAYRQLYEKLNGAPGKVFYETYERFVREVIRPQYQEPIYYQKRPTHRILFRDTPGVSRFHRDRDYGHSTAEINYFLPQTDAFDTNTVWIESEEGKEDFAPMKVKAGQFARFNGASLKHGAQVNTTGKTRVSFDFRVIPLSRKPENMVDTSSWKEEDKHNPLFLNAHHFDLCR